MFHVSDISVYVPPQESDKYHNDFLLIIIHIYTYMRRFTSTAPARGARAPNRAISNSCL